MCCRNPKIDQLWASPRHELSHRRKGLIVLDGTALRKPVTLPVMKARYKALMILTGCGSTRL
jgi:hypothetical protein